VLSSNSANRIIASAKGAISVIGRRTLLFQLPKPKKGEIYGTFNNDMCFERGLEELKKIEGIVVEPLDSHTIKITRKGRGEALEESVNHAIRSSKGYVEHDLENINAIKVKKGERRDTAEPGILDTPFYG
jgi:hypothetical protein